MSEQPNVTIQNNREKSRYEAIDESGAVAGFIDYEMTEGMIIYTHAEVDDAFEGQGVASNLTREALEGARSSGMQVRPACPFVADYLDSHPEYQDLLTR